MKGISIAGRKKNDGIDFYRTPDWAVDRILLVANLEGLTLEPCCGDGAFSNKIKNCLASDIRTDLDVAGKKGVDIFDFKSKCVDCVITNPPYCIAQEVIKKSLEIARKRVYMLLKMQFLHAGKRTEWFKTTPLKTVYCFTKRITMYPANEEPPKNSSTIDYGLFEWEHGYTGEPVIRWI